MSSLLNDIHKVYMKYFLFFSAFLHICLSILSPVQLDAGQTEISTTQDTVHFPLGEISFADSVIHFDPGALGEGTGGEPDSAYLHTGTILGVPDYDTERDSGFVSLGIGGSIVLKFIDNVLIDAPGPDLHIFNREGDDEDIHVWISENGNMFIYIGKMTDEHPSLDIHAFAEPGKIYPFVKLRDDPDQGDPNGPALGADIDAVGAMNTAIRIVIPSHRLYTGKTSSFKEEAYPILKEIADTIRRTPDPGIRINMYTDNQGSEDFNLFISQTQAESVQNHFMDVEHLTDVIYTALGYGETNPIDSNDTQEGRQKNCRLEILIQMVVH